MEKIKLRLSNVDGIVCKHFCELLIFVYIGLDRKLSSCKRNYDETHPVVITAVRASAAVSV